jgi:hypothetical protein
VSHRDILWQILLLHIFFYTESAVNVRNPTRIWNLHSLPKESTASVCLHRSPRMNQNTVALESASRFSCQILRMIMVSIHHALQGLKMKFPRMPHFLEPQSDSGMLAVLSPSPEHKHDVGTRANPPSPKLKYHFGVCKERTPSPERKHHFGVRAKPSPSPERKHHFGVRAKPSPSLERKQHFGVHDIPSPPPK